MEKYKILVVEDDDDVRNSIKLLLKSENYMVDEARCGEVGLEKFSDDTSLIILDIMMNGMTGLEFCESIRKKSTVPILFLTAKASESDKLLGLMAGADDYLTKPFSYAELFARVNSLIRRSYQYGSVKNNSNVDLPPTNVLNAKYIELESVKINVNENEVFIRGERVELTEMEYKILLLMAHYPKKVFSIQNIYESTWDESFFSSSANTVMVHIRNIRSKIEEDNKKPKILTTVWGKGYKLE
ncbi:response regulator transcription factor [Peptostreptococcus porci]|uniref:response regulator transcription factor n=1 Tax=Peptostreptococcus porci TaxID=2652282 RepID=UPI002A911188|nr:response regulator transcription factor [Peptostreptococcus porci]MDY6232355.1 response regulator transcription factor [Peptostreptococcus porci]